MTGLSADVRPCPRRGCTGVLVEAGRGIDEELRGWVLSECSRCDRLERVELADHPGQQTLLGGDT